MNDKTIALVRETLATAGDMGQLAYTAAYKAALARGGAMAALAVIALVAVCVGCRVLMWSFGDDVGYSASDNARLFGTITIIAGALVFVLCGYTAITMLAAPEWAAIQNLAGLVTGR